MLFVAFVAAPLTLLLDPTHSSWKFTDSLSHLVHSWNLFGPGFQWNVGLTPQSIPIPMVWNGPLWTLRYELVMYVLLMPFAYVAVLRNHQKAVITGAWVAAMALTGLDQFTPFVFPVFENFPWLLAYFLSGSMMYVWGDRIPVHRPLSISLFVVAFVVYFFFPVSLKVILVPLFAMGILCLGVVLRSRFAQKRDLSYGMYIYGWPIQQLLLIAGFGVWGITANAIATLALSFVFAFLSWTVIEKPALSLKRTLRKSSVTTS